MAYICGIDLGTSSMKGIVIDQNGKLLGSAQSAYPLIVLESGTSEQDPKEWIRAFHDVLFALIEKIPDLREELVGISFSGQMHSLVILDQHGDVIRNAILWNDVRTSEECREISDVLGNRLLEITKNRALEGFTLPKLLWVKKHEPQHYQRIARFMMPKDYLSYYLCGNQATEYSDAAGTLLLDINTKQWSQEILNAFDLPESICPPLLPSTGESGTLKASLKQQFGFKQSIKIIAGGADNACAAIASGINQADVGMCSIGTSGVFLSSEASVDKDYQGQLHFFNHVNDAYYSMGVTLAAGNSLNWFKNTFLPDSSFNDLLSKIEQIPLGSKGLLFTPYISGERSPHVDSQIRGSFIGLDIAHTLDHMARAVLEGITFSLNDSKCVMDQFRTQPFSRIISVGGGSKNKVWLQMQADIFNTDIYILDQEEGPAFGAAMIAAVGCQWFDDFKSCTERFVTMRHAMSPIPENVAAYQNLYQLYQSIYPSTKDLCHQLNDYRKA